MYSQNFLIKNRNTWPVIVQYAGAHRKPLWLPVAKSKIFRIPKRPVIPKEEVLELQRIHNNYKTQMRAIKRFYYEESIKEMSSLQDANSEMSLKVEADEWERCVSLNEKWNAKVAAEREERRKIEIEQMEKRALFNIEERDRQRQLRIQQATEEIRRQKELNSTFITPENLEAAIDHALANPTDYNYAINLDNHRFEGRDTPAIQPRDDKKISAKV